MRRIWGVLCLVLMMEMTLSVGTPGLSLDIGAGRSYVDNLNNARTNDLKEESGFTSTWISVGLSERALKEARLYLKGSYEGAYYDYFSDLSVNGLTAEAGLFSPVTDSLLLKVSPNVGMRSYGSSDRDSAFYGFLLSLRHQTLSRFATKVGYRYTNNEAEEAGLSTDQLVSGRIGFDKEDDNRSQIRNNTLPLVLSGNHSVFHRIRLSVSR